MKNKILFMAFIALFVGTFSSCKKDEVISYPNLYVVNGTNYTADVYCDNLLVAIAGAHNNSGKVVLANTSVNLPVYVEVNFYDTKGTKVDAYHWDSFSFRWNTSYKMTLSSSGGKLQEL